jgi:hypothetical protein
MNIAIDCDGTATAYPDFFVKLGRAWKYSKAGSVYILTGNRMSTMSDRIAAFPFLADSSWYDCMITREKFTREEEDLLSGDMPAREVVARFKQRIAKDYDISIIFDDDAALQRKYALVPAFEVPPPCV